MRLTNDGQLYVRYLPLGAEADTPRKYHTVGTYPVKNAYRKLQKTLERGRRMTPVEAPGSAIAGALTKRHQNVYLAFPRVPSLQIEVYDPSAGLARSLVESGKVVPIR